jgi:hypothetical protein
MAVVLFEGFERPGHPDVWSISADSAYIATYGNNGYIYGYAGRQVGPSAMGSNGLYMPNHNGYQQSTLTAVFAPQTNKTIYFGVAITNLGSLSSSANVTNNRQQYIAFCSADGTEQIAIGFEHNSTAALDSFGAYVYNAPNNYYGHYTVPIADYNVGGDDNNGVYINNANRSNFVYLEVEITAANTVAIRLDGRYLFSANSTSISVPSIAPIAQVKFFTSSTGTISLDDMYLLNNDGDTANTWLGPDTYVLPLRYPAETTVATWSSVPADTSLVTDPDFSGYSTTPLTAEDADTSYIYTATYPRVQLYPVLPQGTKYGGYGWSDYYAPSDIGNRQILGMEFWASARKTTQDSAYKLVYTLPTLGNTVYDLSPRISVTAVNYTRTGIINVEKNPATNAAWTVDDIYTNGLFGVKSVDPA